MRDLVDRLLAHPGLGKVVHHRRIEGAAAVYREAAEPLSEELSLALEAQGIGRL